MMPWLPCCPELPSLQMRGIPWISQGMQVGVLLVRLCSASLQTGGELTHPAVRLTIGKQVLPWSQPALVHIQTCVLICRSQPGLRHKPSTRHPRSSLVCLKWQVRQTVQYASLNGGRVTWDATPFAFAMAIDPKAPTEVLGRDGGTCRHMSVQHWSGTCGACCCTVKPERRTASPLVVPLAH